MFNMCELMCQDISVRIVTGQDDQRIMVGFQAGAVDYSLFPQCADQLWDLPILLFSGLWGSFLRDKAART
jgi:hypothetical protein